MNFLEQNESAEDRTKLYMENNPSLKLRAKLLLSWLKDVGDLSEDATLEDIIFVGDYYDLDRFSVEGSEYAVGSEYDTHESAVQYIKEMIDSEGISVFNQDFVKSHLDMREVMSYAEDYFNDDVYNYAEAYFDDKDRMLSSKQKEQVEILTNKQKRLENGVKQFQNFMEKGNEDFYSSKISEFEELIDDYTLEILEIRSDPQGEFPDELIDDMIATKLREVKDDPWWFFDDLNIDYDQFVDIDALTQEAIDTDGYGHYLATYDGEAHEVYADGDLFYIMRID
jgi:hypothetical protein